MNRTTTALGQIPAAVRAAGAAVLSYYYGVASAGPA